MLSNPDDDLVQRKPTIIKTYQTTKKDNELINYTKTLYPRRFDEYDKFNKHFGFTLADNGLLMYEGNYKTRTKESVFSWDIVISIIKELINDGKYLDTEKEEKRNLICSAFLMITSLYMMKYLKHHFLLILAYHNRLLMKHYAVDSTIKTAEYK